MEPVKFGTDSEYVAFRTVSGVGDSWQSEALIRLPSFSGSISFFAERHDYVRFLDELEALRRTLVGRAEFSPIEGQFVLHLEGNGRGTIEVSGVAFEHATYGSKLEFFLSLDQTFLNGPIEALGRVAKEGQDA